MKLTKNERIVLINQYKILAALDKSEASHYEELIEILENGYEIFYSLIDDWVSEDMPTDEAKFVLDVLDMYRVIESVKRNTDNAEILTHHRAFFAGFDGNNETNHMVFCRFLIQKQGKYQEQIPYLAKNDNLNSHIKMGCLYQKMVDVWKQFQRRNELSESDVLTILNA